VVQNVNLSFKNKFLYISVIDEANNFQFGRHPGFAKAYRQLPPEEKVGVALG